MADQERKDNLTPEQRGELLRMLLEGHDQKQFARKTDASAKVPGKDAIETVLNGEKLPEQGILVHAEVKKGYEGVVSIYCYDKIEKTDISDSRPKYDEVRMHVSFGSGKELVMAYENPNYFYKNREPFDRMQTTSYIGFTFNDLDIIDLSDHGRLLVLKEASENSYGSSTSFDRRFEDVNDDHDGREILVVFDKDDYVGACEAVYIIMSKLIGANDQDAELITQEVGKRLEK